VVGHFLLGDAFDLVGGQEGLRALASFQLEQDRSYGVPSF